MFRILRSCVAKDVLNVFSEVSIWTMDRRLSFVELELSRDCISAGGTDMVIISCGLGIFESSTPFSEKLL